MAERPNLSGDEIRKRKSFRGLSREDEVSINLLRPLFQKTVPAFVTLLHQRIRSFPETAPILEKGHSQSWLLSRHAEYFIELVSGPYDMAYLHTRLAAGISHQEIGLGPAWVQASFGLFLDWACRTLREGPDSPLSANPRQADSLARITLFDSGLVMDSYFMAENERNMVLSRICETNAEAVWIFDGKWTLRHANKTSEKIIGWTPSELVGKSFENFLVNNPAESDHGMERLMEMAAREGHWEGGLLLTHRNGSEFSIWATLHLLDETPESGNILEFRDRKAEKQVERELLQKTNDLLRSNRDLEPFAYMASHDLQEPLRMVPTYTQLLAQRYEGRLSDEADEFIRFSVGGVIRMQPLINALAYLRREPPYENALRPDIILLDLNLPKMDGREVLSKIKADPVFRRIPVVIITSSEAEQDILRTYDLHVNCYVTKPVDLDQFIKLVQSIESFWLTIVQLPMPCQAEPSSRD